MTYRVTYHSVCIRYSIFCGFPVFLRNDMTEHILIIHQGALGDVILSFPALMALKQKRPVALSLLASHQVGRIACELGIVDACFGVESARFCGLFARDLNDEITAFVNAFHGIIIISLSLALENNIMRRYHGRVCTVTPRPAAHVNTHVADHIVGQMASKGLLMPDPGGSTVGALASLGSVPAGMIRACHGAAQWEKDLFVIHPGAGSPRKRWGLDRFTALADVINKSTSAEVLFLVGPAEKDFLPPLTKAVVGRHIRVVPMDDLNGVAALMAGIRCFVGNDSGLAHLAGFLGVPTAAIFGPSSPERWAPLGKAVKVLRGVWDCPACFETEKHNCEDPRCLDDVSVAMVVDAMATLGVI
jgi:heptosyltransferase III